MSDCCKQTSSFYTSDRLTRIEARLAALEEHWTKVDPPKPPTDSDPLDALRRELGKGWGCRQLGEGGDFLAWHEVQHPGIQMLRACLHQPNGVQRTAEALKWLAQEGEGA